MYNDLLVSKHLSDPKIVAYIYVTSSNTFCMFGKKTNTHHTFYDPRDVIKSVINHFLDDSYFQIPNSFALLKHEDSLHVLDYNSLVFYLLNNL